MPYLYVVRCNFTKADLEPAWNDWYSGQKIRQLLSKPMFRAAQRFRLSCGSGRNYLAIWQVASPEAFNTSAYLSDWGFSEWSPHIADWSRDLFDAPSAQETALAVPPDGCLEVISFDGMDRDGAESARAVLPPGADSIWCHSVGLDRHTPLIGFRRRADASRTQMSQPLPARVQWGVYRPISHFYTADAC